GKIAAEYVKGIQSLGVVACVKHFAVNNREYARMYCDSRVDEQTLRETYLTGFEIAVKEGGARAVMTSYNMLNGVYCNQNSYLINGVLRGEWGFDGLVVSDWGGSRNRIASIKAGADLEMPMCNLSTPEIISAVKKGELNERVVDQCVERVYSFARNSDQVYRKPYDRREHAEFARKAAEESLVLLKNENSALPLKQGERVALIGDFAKKPRYQGAGSSQIQPTSLGNILGAIKQTSLKFVGYSKGFERFGGKNNALLNGAVRLAKKADTIVLCLGLDEDKECEGCDRKDLNINENQINLLKALSALGKKIVVVLSCGSPVLTDWDEDCQALLLGHLGGQSGAGAVVRALTGEVNPSGRLAETYPLSLSDVPCADIYSESAEKCDYAEGIYVGYKYYSAFDVKVKYPFGYGLSYTSFEYSNYSVDNDGVRFTVKNTGGVAGAVVPQIYITAPRANLKVSPKELKLFDKIYLEAGESKEVFLPFDDYSFRMWSSRARSFEAGGIYKISLCSDSQTEIYSANLEITQDNLPQGLALASGEGRKLDYTDYYNSHISDDETEFVPQKGMPVSLNMQVADLIYCKGVLAKIFGQIARRSSRSSDKLKSVALDHVPVRSLIQFMGLSETQAEGFLQACDGQFFMGVKKLLKKK
ncbi:MAG: glycoside hydrolase family 3 C-terminal domain-containing protein, partial [Clostridia bacterium]|nr:glycoside hydrolase family 3 C-terminal domain-containing protein [Clostridia bacterium]